MQRSSKFTQALKPIPADPEPTAAAIQKEMKRLRFFDGAKPGIERKAAAFFAQCRMREADPNAFLVAFVPDPQRYNEYLKSPLWKAIRQRVLQEADYICACCGSRATQVHHRDYRPRVLAGEDPSPLVAVCAPCHKLIDTKNGKPRNTWQDKEAVLATLVAQRIYSDADDASCALAS